MTDKTHLNWLADIFDFQGDILSVGDLLLELGEFGNSFSLPIWGVVVVEKLLKQDAKK